MPGVEEPEPFLAVGRLDHVVTRTLQQLGHEAADVAFVVDDEHAAHRVSLVSVTLGPFIRISYRIAPQFRLPPPMALSWRAWSICGFAPPLGGRAAHSRRERCSCSRSHFPLRLGSSSFVTTCFRATRARTAGALRFRTWCSTVSRTTRVGVQGHVGARTLPGRTDARRAPRRATRRPDRLTEAARAQAATEGSELSRSAGAGQPARPAQTAKTARKVPRARRARPACKGRRGCKAQPGPRA